MVNANGGGPFGAGQGRARTTRTGASTASAGRWARRGARLARLVRGGVEAVFPLPGRPVVIGRDPASDIPVADPRASKRHAALSFHRSRLVLEDLDSRNGTYVNEHKEEARVLTPGDVLRVGDTLFVYLVDDMPLNREDAEPVGWLVGRKWVGGGLKAPVSEKPLLIGCAPEADVAIVEVGFADFQAQVVAGPGGAEVIELTETPPRRTLLADGEQLKIGTTMLKYVAGNAALLARPPAPKPHAPPVADVFRSLEDEARRVEAESPGVRPPVPAPKAWKLWVAVRNGPLAGQDFPVGAARILIGWDRKAKIHLLEKQVSRYHAAIRREEGDLVIEDLDSDTGVFVNGTQVRRKPLKPGDLIRIGTTELLVHL